MICAANSALFPWQLVQTLLISNAQNFIDQVSSYLRFAMLRCAEIGRKQDSPCWLNLLVVYMLGGMGYMEIPYQKGNLTHSSSYLASFLLSSF